MTTLNVDDVAGILATLTHDMQAQKDYLIELDSAVGDGDLGITVDRGFQGVRDGLEGHAADIGKMLFKAGFDFSNSAGSTMGALMGTAFMRAGKLAQGKIEISLDDLAQMVKAAEDGIREKGKASPGDKTMLDALIPGREALEAAAAHGASFAAAMLSAQEAAEKGAIATTNMQATFGRARWLGERVVGHQDPGATLVFLMAKSLCASLEKMGR
jgi:phosphoenolpyruvate---glycerone phosphotransferase subunit DhaL